MQKLLLTVDKISTFVGKVFSWLIVSLTFLITYEVFSRYALDAPHDWAFDMMLQMYGTLFMMAGAYTLSKNNMVRGDVLYGFFPPRLQAGIDLTLYMCSSSRDHGPLLGRISLPGDSWAIFEHSGITANGPPVYHFKTVIPVAGVFVLLQGIVEIIRCIRCLKDGKWPPRLEDVEEVDVEKLKKQTGVKDEDIAKLDEYVTHAKGGDQ
jgi:TRAP-type mannitol/chloroaromatic compound transport system permease small subunit